MAEAGCVELHAIAQVHIALGNIGQAMESVNKSLDERGLFRPFSNSTRKSIHCARTPRTDHRLLEERLEQCHKGETIRGVQSRRIDKSGREHKGLLTLSLLTDERGAPERSP
jgi:hypothetical protein